MAAKRLGTFRPPAFVARAAQYLLRDRDAIYGNVFVRRVKGLGMSEILIAPRAPWQNPFAERLIGSTRRECLDQVIVINERHLRRLLRLTFAALHLACMRLIPAIVPPHLAATAQAMYALGAGATHCAADPGIRQALCQPRRARVPGDGAPLCRGPAVDSETAFRSSPMSWTHSWRAAA
jgi:transposase InsO family protein